AGDTDGAGNAWAEAARLGGPDAGVAWAKALDAWVAAGAFDRAREAAAALPALDVGALVDAVTDAPHDALRDPAWQLRPGLARWNLRDGTLDAEAVAGAGVLARLPLERLGDEVRARIGLRVARQEWGSGVTVRLGPPGVEAAIFRTFTMGGGGFLLHETVFRRPAPAGCHHGALQSGAALGARIVLDVVLSGRGGWLSARDDHGPLLQCTISPLDQGGADWVLDMTALQTGPVGPLARVQIDEVSVWGLRPRVEAVAPELATAAALAVPRLQPDDATFWSSPDALARFRAVWEGSTTDHAQDAEVREALLRAPDPRALAHRSADARWLLVARGRAAWLAGDAERAERELLAALEAPADASEWSERVTARAILAEIALASGDRTAAQRAREAALAEAPTREAGETSLLRHPELGALAGE
ncbi:MAG: hypothetical protein Q8P41_08690, partial [Pseudomonadota bacterium]|nr:hypothetical protein [Pseudomonadota bacterium]